MAEHSDPAVVAAAPQHAPVVARGRADGMAAVIAACVGLLALGVSGYTAYIQRQQVRAQVWPYLEPDASASKRELFMSNRGVGPAIVRGVRLRVDDVPQRTWKSAFDALGMHFEQHVGYSSLNGTVISANDKVEQLEFPTDAEYQAFAAQARRVHLEVCYCSTLGECWFLDDARHGAEQHAEVTQCPTWPEDQSFDN